MRKITQNSFQILRRKSVPFLFPQNKYSSKFTVTILTLLAPTLRKDVLYQRSVKQFIVVLWEGMVEVKAARYKQTILFHKVFPNITAT